MKQLFFAVFTFLFFYSAAYSRAEVHTPTSREIADAAQSVIAAKLSAPKNARVLIRPQTLDKRFRRPRCISPVKADLVSTSIKRNNTVKLSCETQNAYPWQVYLSVAVDIQYQVAIATKTLSGGELIDESKVTLKYVSENNVRGNHFDSVKAITGTKAKKRIAKGYPVFDQNICFVCKGDAVKIIAQTGSFSVRASGTAQSDGNLHDTIRVMNNNSNKTITAEVIGIGEVLVRM